MYAASSHLTHEKEEATINVPRVYFAPRIVELLERSKWRSGGKALTCPSLHVFASASMPPTQMTVTLVYNLVYHSRRVSEWPQSVLQPNRLYLYDRVLQYSPIVHVTSSKPSRFASSCIDDDVSMASSVGDVEGAGLSTIYLLIHHTHMAIVYRGPHRTQFKKADTQKVPPASTGGPTSHLHFAWRYCIF